MLPAIAARRKAEQGCQPGNRWPATFYQSGSGLGGPTGHAKAPENPPFRVALNRAAFCFPQEVPMNVKRWFLEVICPARRSHEYERKNRSA